ncbi:MAG: ABC transporter ATP-binding protein, partial [Prolixibacteraceae bacterium]|nr:ABC transporter ATP-binding protein [Prolixibacteraceae bacterium]
MILNFLFNLLSALFTVFSVTMLIPILDILFDQAKAVREMMPWAMNLDTLKHNLYYYITAFKEANGAGLALLLIGLFVIVATLLKVGFA